MKRGAIVLLFLIIIISLFAINITKKHINPTGYDVANSNACEANITAGNKCLYVAPNGDDGNNGSITAPFKTFRPAVTKVNPGDFIYARGGTYGPANRMISGVDANYSTKGIGAQNCQSGEVYVDNYCYHDLYNMIAIRDFAGWATKIPAHKVASGTPGNPITIKNYPGEKPVLVMDNNKRGIVGINIEYKSWWVIQGLEIANGGIDIYESHDIWIKNNDIHGRYGESGFNNGLIYIQRSDGSGIGNIYVHNNTLHDMYNLGCDGVIANTASCGQEHFSAVTTMSCEGYTGNLSCGGTKYVEIVNNTIYNIQQAFFFKNSMVGPILIEGNHIYHAGSMGIGLAANILVKNNLIETNGFWWTGHAAVSELVAPITGTNITIEHNTFVNSTFIFGRIERGFGQNIKNNVFFGLPTPTPTGPNWTAPAYIVKSYSYPDPIDETQSYLKQITSNDNCFITPIVNFHMAKRFYNSGSGIVSYNYTQAQSLFGWDKNSIFIQETDQNKVFTNPSAGDYILKAGSSAEKLCADMGISTETYAKAGSPEQSLSASNETNTTKSSNESTTSGNGNAGGGGGGGGGGGSTSAKPSVSISKDVEKANKEAPIIIKNFNIETGVKEIQIEVNNPAQNIKVIVSKYENRPVNVSVEKSGKMYKYLKIETENLENNIKNATLNFQVEKNWTETNSLDKNNIALFKFFPDENRWTELNTTYDSSD
ncbi:MAG: PGF-pre-PGF domain-containing protein, partial [Candidatus Pacearchaeota archaeon]|nr:PGF-pre-PGF domain-containing protein [Candidatus Pacearchaeota archaeon]